MWGTIANIAVQAGTSLISGVQAQKMRKEQRKSEQEAANLMKDIYAELEKNQYAAVGLPMKAFELEREALAAQGAQAVEAGRESERGAAATAGLTMSQYRKALRDIQSEQADKMLDLDLLTAQEAARKGDIKMQFKAQEAEGAAAAAADFEQRKLAAVGGAIEGVVGAAGTAMSAIPLFKEQKQLRDIAAGKAAYDAALKAKSLSPDLYSPSGAPLSYNQALAKRLGLDEAKLKELGMYDDAGVFLDDKFNDWLVSQPREDIRDAIKSGFNPSTLKGLKPTDEKTTIRPTLNFENILNSVSATSPSYTQLYDNLSWMGNPSRN